MRTVSAAEFPISTTITGALLIIEPGALRELHWHPNAAEWQFYLKGSGRMTVFGSHGRVRTDEFSAGDVGYVPQGYGHYIENTGSDTFKVVLALNNATYSPRGRWRTSICCLPPISVCRRACLPSSPRAR
jgi:oxalate decarboxylase